jgi:hypothetical protein
MREGKGKGKGKEEAREEDIIKKKREGRQEAKACSIEWRSGVNQSRR